MIRHWKSYKNKKPYNVRMDRSLHRRQTNLGFLVLDAMCLVDHQVAPVEFLKHRFFLDDHLIRRDADVPFPGHDGVSDKRRLL